MRFAGKIAVITGGASGIGKAATDLLLREGATVYMGDIDDDAGLDMEKTNPDRLFYKHCDVTKDADIRALMDYAADKSGGLDMVFNNAGAGGARETIDEITAEQWDSTMALLLRSTAMGIRHAAPHLKSRGGGAIVNISSISACQTGYAPAAYSVAKAAILQLTKIAAAELAQYNIRVNAICPGFIPTNIFGSSLGLSPQAKAQFQSALSRVATKSQPVRRAGTPEDIAEAMAYLASDAAGFITGTHLVVDGGMLIGPRHSWDPETPGLLDSVLPSA